MSRVVLEAVEQLTSELTSAEKLHLYYKVAQETKRARLDTLLTRLRQQASKHPIADHTLKRVCDEVRQELYEERARSRH